MSVMNGSELIGIVTGVIGTLVVAMQAIILGEIKEVRKNLDTQTGRINILEVKVAKLES